MSRNGSGVYSLPAGNPVVTGTTISSSWANTTLSDIATALTGSVASDGQTAMTGNLQMGNNKVTGLAVATTSGDALSYAQAATVSHLAVTGNATVGGTLTLTGGLTLNGNVTVGDSSSDTLTVNATSTFAAGATFSSTFAANGGVTLGDASGDALTINSSAVSIPNGLNFDSNTFVIDATNNEIGIGTNNPLSKLHVSGSDTTVFSVNGATKGIRFDFDSTQSTIYGVDNTFFGSYQPLRIGGSVTIFTYGGAEAMRIDSSGNVGIGTSSPSAKLDVLGSKDATNLIIGAALNTVGGAAYVNYSELLFKNTAGANSDASIRAYGNVWNIAGSQLAFFTANNSAVTERMRLDSSGNLGLGVTPSAWGGYKVIDIGTNGAGYAGSTESLTATTNAYWDGANWKYKGTTTTKATRYNQYNGQHEWFTAPSGTAGNAISFTQAMTLDASGNLGVGTTSPSSRLQISATSSDLVSAFGNVSIFSNDSQAADKGGSIGFGGVYQSSDIAQWSGIRGAKENGTSGNYAGYLSFFTRANGGSTTERMRIDSSGNLLVGTTTSDGKLSVSNATLTNTARISDSNASSTSDGVTLILAARNTTNNTFYALSYYNTGAGNFKFRVADSGNVTNTNNSYGGISDAKLKENIVDAKPKLADLCDVKVRNFNFIGSEEKQLGVIAQELETVFPSMVEESPDKDAEGNDLGTTTKQVKYSVFVPMLIKAVQELNAKVTALEAQLASK